MSSDPIFYWFRDCIFAQTSAFLIALGLEILKLFIFSLQKMSSHTLIFSGNSAACNRNEKDKSIEKVWENTIVNYYMTNCSL